MTAADAPHPERDRPAQPLTADEARREIEAIKVCPHCGGESDYDKGRMAALDWVARRLEAAATVLAPQAAPRLYQGRIEAFDAIIAFIQGRPDFEEVYDEAVRLRSHATAALVPFSESAK